MLGTESQPGVTVLLLQSITSQKFLHFVSIITLLTGDNMVMFLADVIFTCFLLSNCNGNYDTQLIGGLVPAALGLKDESNYHICTEMKYVKNINLTEIVYVLWMAIYS